VTLTAATLDTTAPECLDGETTGSPEATRERSRARLRVAVLDSHPFSRLRLATMVTNSGLEVGVAAAPGDDALELVVDTGCDAVLLAANDPGRLIASAAPQFPRAVVVCSENTSVEMVHAAERIGAMGFLHKPVPAAQLGPTLAIAVARFTDALALRAALEDRKVIERAKGRLMTLHGTTEETAFRWLRRRAMNSRRRMADVARDVLGTSGLLQPAR